MFDLAALQRKIDEMVKASEELKKEVKDNTQATRELTKAIREKKT